MNIIVLMRLIAAALVPAFQIGGTPRDIAFAPPQTLLEGGLPTLERSVAADVDGDGIVDIVFVGPVTSGERRLYVARGLGNRDFAPLALVAEAGAVGGLPAIADIDGDGDADLALPAEDGALRVLENDGAGSFSRTAEAAGDFTRVVALADADADGDLDVFAEAAGGDVFVATLDAAAWTVAAASTGVAAPLETAVDLDGDGRAELVRTDSTLEVFPASPGGFGAPVVVSTVNVGSENRINLFVADLDGDGNLDLVPVGAMTSSAPTDVVFTGDGNLTFTPTDLLPPGTLDTPVDPVRFFDANGDGVLDLYYIAFLNGDVFSQLPRISLGTGTLPFAEGTPAQFGLPSDQAYLFAPQETLIDLDGDGATDVLSGDGLRYGPYATPTGVITGFDAEQEIGDVSPFRGFVAEVRTIDVDGDGRLDVVSLADPPNALEWQRNLGGFRFGPPEVLTPGIEHIVDLEVGEWAVGEPPLLAFSERDPVTAAWKISVWRDAGSGLAPAGAVDTPPATVIGVGDLNGDGFGDVLTSRGYHALDATGQPALLEPIVGLFDSFGTIFELVDLDRDGDIDILEFNESGGFVSLFRNISSGSSFLGPVRLLSLSGALAAADIDDDGLLDLVLAPFAGAPVLEYLPGQGALTFGSERTLASGPAAGTRSTTAADVDGDGDLDVALFGNPGSALEGGSLWVQGPIVGGTGSFVPVFGGKAVQDLGGFADLDGDGDLDAYDIDFDGALVIAENQFVPRTGDVFCEQPNANSSGARGRLDVYGVPAAGGAPLRLVASSLPENTFGFVIGSPNAV
ncbi:MAG: VCBS repeat-containing protein, partial [Planctomycetota bacterium]